MNKKVLIQWLCESISKWILYVIMFYTFINHNNFSTIILLILLAVIQFTLNMLKKKHILNNIFEKSNKGNFIIPFIGVQLCIIFALNARYHMIAKSIFFVVFLLFSISYMYWQYINFIKVE